MIKYKNLYPKDYNTLLSSGLANSLCILFGVDTIENDTTSEFVDLVNCAKRVDKALIYCPSAVGEWVLESEVALKSELLSFAQLELHCVSDSSKRRNVGLLGMIAGKTISSKDMKKGELLAPTIFDALKKTKKKSLIISTLPASFNDLFKSKSVDIIKVKSGAESVNTALKIIKEDVYDLVFVIDGDYEDCVRIGLPLSKSAKKVLEKQVSRFSLLNDATDVYWKGDILFGFCPERGCHRGLFASRFSSMKPSDTNVTHFYSVKEG